MAKGVRRVNNRNLKLAFLMALMSLVALTVTGCEPLPTEIVIILVAIEILICSYILYMPISAVACTVLAHRSGRNKIGFFFLGLSFSYVGLLLAASSTGYPPRKTVFIMVTPIGLVIVALLVSRPSPITVVLAFIIILSLALLGHNAMKRRRDSVQMKDTIQTPAAFIRDSSDRGKPGLEYGTLVVSRTQIELKTEKRSIRFPFRGIKYVSMHDARRAVSLIPEEFQGKNYKNRSIVEIKPRTRRVQPDCLIVISTEAANTLAARLEPTGLLR